MVNWISPFNYDFAIASIPIQIILILFYGFRRNLPIRQSVFFWIAMSSNLIMTISDIISCEMNEVWMIFPLWIMYAINHAYFLSFIIRGWSLFMYTAESPHSYRESDYIIKVLISLPAFISVLLIVSTPWTSAIYTFADDGYHNCSLYKTIYFSILTILIIFLTSENPDLYRDNRTSLLNKNALNRIGKELWEKKIPFSLITISINNYEASKVVYGVNQSFLPDLISLFKHSRMEIVVEGIETLEMKDKMAELGCDYEQGYYFSKPIPPAEFIAYMEAQAGQV